MQQHSGRNRRPITGKGDRLAFIAKTQELPEGIDIYVGGGKTWKTGLQSIWVRMLLAASSRNPQLVGTEKRG